MTEPVWYRQVFETDPEWAAFHAYRALPEHTRNFAEVALQCGQSIAQVEHTASRCSWAVRIAAFEQHLIEKAARIAGTTPEKMREQRRALIDQLHELTVEGLQQHIEEARRLKARGGAMPRASMRELASMAKTVLENLRLESGEPTAIVAEQLDLSQLSVEELMTLRALQAKATPTTADPAKSPPIH